MNTGTHRTGLHLSDLARALILGGAVGLFVLITDTADAGAAADERYVRGGEAFQAHCAACHGTRAQGGPGPDLLAGPPLSSTDVSYVDMTMRTGRMPIADPGIGVYTEQLDDATREAVVHYMVERFDLPGEIPEVRSGDPGRGQELYVRNCAACHGAAADGGISGADIRVPPLVGTDSVAVAQATRVGPFEMPSFDPAVISDRDIDDIIGYLDTVAATPRTLVGVREVDQAISGLFAIGLGLAAAIVVLLVAYARRWHPDEPGGYHESPPFEPRR